MKTLVIAPHMDDEALSCGALICSRIADGDHVSVLVMSGRVYDYGKVGVNESFGEQSECCYNATSVMGVEGCNVFMVNMDEGEPAKVGYYKALYNVESALKEIDPDEVIVPSFNDLNQDHRHYADVCRIALRAGNLGNVKRVLAMRAFDSVLAEPSYYLAFGEEILRQKVRAIECYHTEAREVPHPRALKNIEAYHRVMGAKAGSEFAEPYDVIFWRE